MEEKKEPVDQGCPNYSWRATALLVLCQVQMYDFYSLIRLIKAIFHNVKLIDKYDLCQPTSQWENTMK